MTAPEAAGTECGALDIALMGYPSRWSVRAGTTVEFMVSARADSFQAEIIRVTGRGPRDRKSVV